VLASLWLQSGGGVDPPAASQGPLTMSVRFLPWTRPGCVVPAIPGITLL
jgi:hypothetical protein